MNEEIKKIIFEGTDAQRKYLFQFNLSNTKEEIVKKFNLWARYFYPKFFKSKDAPFHTEMLDRLAGMYLGQSDEFLNIGFRGCSKTTYTKLFMAYVLANDTNKTRKYLKVLSEDVGNSKQVVTDLYNLLIQPRVVSHYPELWTKTDSKREETMSSFTTSTGIKVVSGSIGQEQRGQIQEDSRPDFLWFDDIESRNTLRSAVKTRQIWDNMQEAINGLAKDGITTYTCNYISERGNVHRLVERVKNKMIVPIWDDNKIPTWDRFTVEEIKRLEDKADDFEGEYLCKPSASKDVLFDRESIERQVAKLPIKESNGFKQFKEYKVSNRVAGGADVAGGLGLDSSTSVYIDFDTVPAQVIGTYHNNEIKPSDFGHELARQGRMFGECLIAPENNKFDETIGTLKLVYPTGRIYQTERDDTKIAYKTSTTFGWNTNSFSKTRMFNDLVQAVENGWLDLNDENLIREARGYTRNDIMDREVDPRMVTNHFDLLTACAIAWQMKDYAKRGSEPKYTNPIDEMWERRQVENALDMY